MDNNHEHDDFSMAYQDSCSGPTLLLIHGFPLNSSMWEPQLEDLSDIARIIAPDLRGHGQSDAMPGPYSTAMIADDCVGLLDALGIQEPVVVCGMSMGGYIALELYRQHPDLVEGLILVSTRAGADSEEGKAGRDRAADRVEAEGPQVIVADMLPKMMAPETYEIDPDLASEVEAMMQTTSPEGMVGALMAMKERADSTSMLAEIDVPTLIIHGAEDQIIPLSEARAMREAIPDAELVVIPEAGHLANLEQPEDFNAAVWDFLESLITEIE